jgi:diguanylate cyclase (GGDEF)-like protein
LTSWEERVPKVLNAVGLHSIKNRILALALVATLVPALGTAVLSYRQNRLALTENLNGELRSRGSQAAREVDLWVKERSYDVRIFTGSFEVSENLERIPQGGAAAAGAGTRLADYLTGVHGRFNDYVELQVMDADAQPVASSNETVGTVDLAEGWLVRLERGETVLGEPSRMGTPERVAATLAAPIFTPDGRFLGVLAATLAFDAITGILEGLAPGQNGRVDLVTGAGELIASSRAAAGSDVDVNTLGLLAAAGGASAEYVDREQTPMVGTSTTVPGLTWAVVAQIPTADAYSQVEQLRNSAFLLVSVLLVVVGVLAYLLGTVIVRPLVRLTAGAGAVAAGDLSVDLPVAGRGEVGYLTEVFNDMVGRLRQSRHELDARNKELEHLSVTDVLTGLHNRRYLLDAFDKEIRRADRGGRSFCVLMIDVDRFKEYNDAYGHPAGDQVLVGMGRVIPQATRDLDVAARYGGEEFLVLLPECELANGVTAGERIRARLARESFDGHTVTISVGVAEFPMHGDSAGSVIAAADEALYESKRLGRDRVTGAALKPIAEVKQRATRRSSAAKKRRSEEATGS